jgi:hypothetical protein
MKLQVPETCEAWGIYLHSLPHQEVPLVQLLAGTAVHVHVALEAEGGPVDGAVEVGCTRKQRD